MTRKEWNKRKQRKIIAIILAFIIVAAGLTAIVLFILKELKGSVSSRTKEDSLYLTVNEATRTGVKSPLIGVILVRNSGFTGLSGVELRNRYERADILNPLMKDPVEESAHYAIGVDGVCIQLIPLTERAPGGDDRIIITYSPDENGNISEAEEKAINDLLDDLQSEYNIADTNVVKEYE